jgi:hypothetical protein
MLIPIGHLQLWDGNIGVHARIVYGTQMRGEALVDPVAGEDGVIVLEESVFLDRDRFPDNFWLLAKPVNKAEATARRAELGIPRWTSHNEVRFMAKVELEDKLRPLLNTLKKEPAASITVRLMSWSGGEAIWIEHLRSDELRTIVIGPSWGGEEKLQVVRQHVSDLEGWVKERMGAMEGELVWLSEVRKFSGV